MGKSEVKCDCEIIHKDIALKVKNNMLSNNILDSMANFYKAFSDNTRLKIINALDQHEMCVCDISAILNMTKSAVSHQLKFLKNKHIVKSRKQGKEVFYQLSDEHVKQIFEVCLEHINEGEILWRLK